VKLLVVGAGGGLGRAFLSVATSEHEIHAYGHRDLDVGDHEAVLESVGALRPDAILNFAALTKVDACESNPREAFRTNALGAQTLALAARTVDAVLLHVSTDYVFDGKKGAPYDELDLPNPLSVYARSKLAAESFVRHLRPESFVIRTGYVFGSGTDHFSGQMRRLVDGETAAGLGDRVGSPTFVRHLAARLLPLVRTGRFGTYHLAGPEPTTWFDLLCTAKRVGGLSGEVVRQNADELALPAPRPRDSSLTSLFAEAVGVAPLPPLREALAEMFES
jgi:dTDP-4-dehydrorhamnose reductase